MNISHNLYAVMRNKQTLRSMAQHHEACYHSHMKALKIVNATILGAIIFLFVYAGAIVLFSM